MALKPTYGNHVPIPLDTVLEMRKLYFVNGYSLRDIDIHYDFEYSLNKISNAVNGKTRYYQSIEDDISEHTKEERRKRGYVGWL